jgi:cytochrome c553
MIRTLFLLVAAALLLATHSSACAGDAASGRLKARTGCNTCHGSLGIAVMPGAANLAGQSQDYLVEQLRNFRSGKRQHEVMSLIARPLSDADIEDYAAWFSSLKIQVQDPGSP